MKLSIVVLVAAASAVVSAATVKTGLDVLIAHKYKQLAGKKVIMLTNPTGITPQLDLGLDVMFESKAVNLVGVMGPEHGFRGTAPAGGSEGESTDPKTGLTVYDAYQANTTALMGFIKKSGADTVLYDIQDVGARFYTYTWAMYDTMVAAALTNTTFVVLDRPNPTTGLDAFGPVLDESFVTSYVGRRAIAQAHGMTVGELARLFVGEGWIAQAANGSKLALDVIPMAGWRRDMAWEATGLPWVLPSPNMPTPATAAVYAGACLFEGTSLSEGRGTTRPFELLGAPWANESWTDAMRAANIPNASFRFACFNPTTSKFEGNVSCGLQTYLSLQSSRDWATWDAPFLGVSLLHAARNLFANGTTSGDPPTDTAFHWLYSGKPRYDVDVLVGSPLVREGIENGLSPDQIRTAWTPRLNKFRRTRKKYLMY